MTSFLGVNPPTASAGQHAVEVPYPETDVVEAGPIERAGACVIDHPGLVEAQELHLLVRRGSIEDEGHVIGRPIGDAHVA